MVRCMVTTKWTILLIASFTTLFLLFARLYLQPRPYSSGTENLRDRLHRLFPYDLNAELPKHIWQTWKHSPAETEFEVVLRDAEASWTDMNPDFKHDVITDDAAELLIDQLFAEASEVREAYKALPKPVLKADLFRYLILLARGGVYSDIDTTALKAIEDWTPNGLHPYGLAVGIEADPDRPDWNDWYARRIQFCQWTIAGKPGHPVLVDIVASITEEILRRKANGELARVSMTWKAVMEFTGPGVWTDSLFRFFNDPPGEKDVTWERFAGLKEMTKEGDVVVFPITSFSPGVGHMGSGSTNDPIAYVRHTFSGSWKDDERGDE